MYEYTYLLKALIFGTIWLGLWLWRKDNHKEMFIISVATAISGPIVDALYTIDWWSPETVTGTIVGIESVLVGFMIGGIAAVAYEDIFRKKLQLPFLTKLRKKKNMAGRVALVFGLMALIFLDTYFIIGLNSLLATLVPILILLGVMYYQRPDLIPDSIASGILLVVIAGTVYSLLEFITPGWIDVFWHFKNVSRLFFLGLPIDDLLWYFFAGAFIGPLYEFLQKAKTVYLD